MELNPKLMMTRAQMFAAAIAYRIQQNRMFRGTPARRHKHVHDRVDGPASRTSLHMLRRSINLGFTGGLPVQPHVLPRSKRAKAAH